MLLLNSQLPCKRMVLAQCSQGCSQKTNFLSCKLKSVVTVLKSLFTDDLCRANFLSVGQERL